MKIFGFDITRQKEPGKPAPEKVADAPVEIRKVEPIKSTPPALIPSVRTNSLSYNADRASGRGVFISPEYDLPLIGRVEDTDGYVRQSFQKKLALMFKEGYDFVGPNKETTQYLKIRLAQISKASNIPTTELLRALGSGLIKKSNAFLVKVRKAKASGGRRRITADGKNLDPIAAYFILPAETMEVDADEYGKIRKWRQRLPSGNYQDHMPENVVHIFFDKKEGFMFGTPTIVPVVDDIRALRKIEENVELLVYQHLFPLFHYKVGTETAPAGVTENGALEVDVVREEIQYMPSEGGIVTPERHEITMIGAEGRALRAETYLAHFKQRVFAGLGISGVDMGDGATANRATADNMSRALIDSVKDFQAVLETQFNHFIIHELLLESTFGDEVLNTENLVKLRFAEIDIEKRMKIEKHAREMFEGNGITWAELRSIQGREAIIAPNGEDDDPTGNAEWNDTSWKLFDEPKALIQAVDEPYSPAAKAAAESALTSVTPQNVTEAGEEETAAEIKKIKAKPKPKPPAKKKKDSIQDFLGTMYDDLEENIIFNVKKGDFDKDYLRNIAMLQGEEMHKRLTSRTVSAFLNGYSSKTRDGLSEAKLLSARNQLEVRSRRYINRLIKNTISALNRNIDSKIANDNISLVRSVFSSLKYRVRLIEDVEVRRAHNYGIVHALEKKGITQVTFETNGGCEVCSDAAKTKLDINTIGLEDMPPFHGDCGCKLKAVEV